MWKLSFIACSLQLKLNLTNLTERDLGPFKVSVSQNGSSGETAVMVNGLQSMVMRFLWIISALVCQEYNFSPLILGVLYHNLCSD